MRPSLRTSPASQSLAIAGRRGVHFLVWAAVAAAAPTASARLRGTPSNMPHLDSSDLPRLPLNLLRRRKQFRLRRRHYGECPILQQADDSQAREQVSQLLAEKREWTGKAAQLQDMLLRSRSDLESFRRRVQRDRDDTRTTLTADLLMAFLPMLDHFDLAVRAAQSSSDSKAILEGVVMIQREMVGLLQSLGLDKIEDAGQPFDPARHEAVATETRPDLPDQSIIEVLRPGWRHGDRCLRAAMVKVNRIGESAPASPLQP